MTSSSFLPKTRALVIGGGFSGMAAAIELRRFGAEVVLVETDPAWRSYGAGISLGGPTLRVFRSLGILDAFLAEGCGSDGLDLVTPDGRMLTQLPTPRVAGENVPGGGAIMRPTLARIMSEATRRSGTDVRLGCTPTSIRQDAEGVEVVLSDGRSGRFDLAIGADGLNSQTRRWLLPDAPVPTYTGQGVWRAVLPRFEGIDRCRMWVGGAVKIGVNPVSASQMYLFLTETRPVNDRIAQADQPPMLRDLLAPFPDPVVRRMREQIDADAQVVYRPLENLLVPRPWYSGRVVLIGDAVHATTPHLASGACIGIEDGVVLADELARAATIGQGFESFQARRWERCRMVVENSSRLGELEITNGDKAEHARLMGESMMALSQPV